jgi:hypothetical protein
MPSRLPSSLKLTTTAVVAGKPIFPYLASFNLTFNPFSAFLDFARRQRIASLRFS